MSRERAPDRSRGQACRVCGCTERNACMTEEGPCFWLAEPGSQSGPGLCSACAAAADHVVSMTVDMLAAEHVATCRCNWSRRASLLSGPERPERLVRLDDAIRAHWQAVVAEAAS